MFFLVEDPNYQSTLVLKDKNESIIGYTSYKPGDSEVLSYVHLNNAYIFFETYKRVYVFQVQAENNLSTNILVFNKKQSDFIANNIYLEYFRETQHYFNSSYREMNEELIDNVLDNLKIITIAAQKSNFFDTLIYRLTKVRDVFEIPPFSIIDNAIKRYNATKNDSQISTLLKIAHYLGANLSILLSDEDLVPHVQIDQNRPPLSDLASQSKVPLKTLASISTGRFVPKYSVMKNITDVLGIDIKEFLIKIIREMPKYQLDSSRDQNEVASLEFIGNRIKQAMFLAELDVKKILKVYIDRLGKFNPNLKPLLRTSYATGIKLAVLVGDTSLKANLIQTLQDTLRCQKII